MEEEKTNGPEGVNNIFIWYDQGLLLLLLLFTPVDLIWALLQLLQVSATTVITTAAAITTFNYTNTAATTATWTKMALYLYYVTVYICQKLIWCRPMKTSHVSLNTFWVTDLNTLTQSVVTETLKNLVLHTVEELQFIFPISLWREVCVCVWTYACGPDSRLFIIYGRKPY